MTPAPTYFTAHLREIDGSYVQPNHFKRHSKMTVRKLIDAQSSPYD